ncbi:MAG: NrdH-redoxin [Clostridium butyricum]|nr:NrdH-redoxin [Clostridium butyricum]
MIKIYSTSWCPDCIKAKKYFDIKGVNYTEINVADKHEDREEVYRISGQRTVPVIKINDCVIVGFDKKTIDIQLNK